MKSAFLKKLRSADNRYWLLIALFFVLPVSVSGISIALLGGSIEYFINSPAGMALFYLIAGLAMAMALIPSTFVAVLSGWLFGWSGLAALVPSYMLASIVGVFIGKFLNRKITGSSHFQNSKIELYSRNFADAQFSLMFFLRLSPVVTFASVNMAVSRLQIRWFPFLCGTLLGMLPRTFLFFLAGMQAHSLKDAVITQSGAGLESKAVLFSTFLLLSVLGLIIIFVRITKKIMHNTENKSHD